MTSVTGEARVTWVIHLLNRGLDSGTPICPDPSRAAVPAAIVSPTSDSVGSDVLRPGPRSGVDVQQGRDAARARTAPGGGACPHPRLPRTLLVRRLTTRGSRVRWARTRKDHP